jgi:indole-3-glycerol phosphate synthase
LKPRSPSFGILNERPDIPKIVDAYKRHAAAISVLTDARYFGGSAQLLTAVHRLAPTVPLLWKDFVLDELQVGFIVG